MIVTHARDAITVRLKLELRPADGEIGWEVVMHDISNMSDEDFTAEMTSVVMCCDCRNTLNDPAFATADPSEPNCGGVPLKYFAALARAHYLDEAAAATNKYRRADVLRRYRIYATCHCSRALILSVEDAGIVGCALQANLHGPADPAPRLLGEMVRHNQAQFPVKPKKKLDRRSSARRASFLAALAEDSSSDEEGVA